MIVNQVTLKELFVGLSTAYQTGFNSLTAADGVSDYLKIATVIPSSTRENAYGWLGNFPAMRKWIGDRTIKRLRQDAYRIVNDKYEATVEVAKDDLEDDQSGQYAVQAQGYGLAAAKHPNQLIFAQLAAGFATNCYDGQFFFDTDHPLVKRDGTTATVSNYGGGSGEPWFLLDTRQALKPLIFQKRRDYAFRAVTNLEDARVFMNDQFLFGTDARVASGYGFWQMGYASKQTLDPASLNAAIAAMMAFKDEDGLPLGVMPNLLVVGSGNRSAALQTVKTDRVPLAATVTTSGTNFTGGNSNIAYQAVDLMVTPWL